MIVAVLLSGSGVYDGTEIQEAVLSLLSLNTRGIHYQCCAPNVDQHHVINHLTGEESNETRNVMTESARIARGDIKASSEIKASEYDGLVIPGGFGTAKNHTKWAFSGPEGEIEASVKQLILDFRNNDKPILGLCMGPTTIAKAFQDSEVHATLTVGSTKEASPYEIDAISAGMESIGAKAEMKTLEEISIDPENKIITAPCYMMEADIGQVHKNIDMAVESFSKML